MVKTDSKIAIVGAGVFGLSTALHLKKRGYQNVTVFDYQPYDKNGYDPEQGCDAASADVNKILRFSYGKEIEYQDAAYEGRARWVQWNEDILNTPERDLPTGFKRDTTLFVPCGVLRMASGCTLSQYDLDSLEELEKAGLRDDNYRLQDTRDMERLRQKEAETPGERWSTRVHILQALRDKNCDGFLDTSAGFVYSDKACAWARHLCEKEGVQFVLGTAGRLDHLITDYRGEKKHIKGIVTADGNTHDTDLVIVACGGWTPSMLPEVNGRLETTAGSVVLFKLPPDRKDLWEKFAPENFPVWAYGLTGHHSPEYGGFYGFPRTPNGIIKMGYRGRKWTNFETIKGQRLSVPKTKWTERKATNLPKKALMHLKGFIAQMFPELKSIGISDTRLCWYTDSLDNHFLIDYVPDYDDSLFVASGGSGHGFKFLPVLGDYVVNAIERKADKFTPLWKWRSSVPGEPSNGLEEGEQSGRNLADLEIAEEMDWVWEEQKTETLHNGHSAGGLEIPVAKLSVTA